MAERRKSIEPAKVMDIAHPSQVQPQTTSRPVIVTNRPMLPEDPMINKAALSAIDTEKPANEPADTPTVEMASAPDVPRQGKAIVPMTDEDQQADHVVAVALAANDKDGASIPVATDKPNDDVSKDTESVAPESTGLSLAAKKPPEPKKTETKTTNQESSDAEPSSNLFVATDDVLDQGDEASKEETAEKKRHDELEAIIAAGTYKVPVGQVAKRRGRMIAVMIVAAVFLLVLLDVVLDMGLFKISGVPHTTFFN